MYLRSPRFAVGCAAVLLWLSLGTPALFAQGTAATGPASSTPTQAHSSMPDAPQPQKPKPVIEMAPDGGSKTRILGIAPQFGAVDESVTEPMTAGQKFHLFLRSYTDPFIFAAMGVTSGISQADNSHNGYGQGMAGYGKRYGAGLADELDGAFWGNCVLPVLLKEDPRYFRKGGGTIQGRAWYAFRTTFVTRTDKGTSRFNTSNVLGNFISGSISNAYYPKDERGFGLTLSNAAVVTLLGSLGAEGEEFYPDIDCHFIHRSKCRQQRETEGRHSLRPSGSRQEPTAE